MFRREAPGKPWQIVSENEALPAGDLLIGLTGSTLASANGAVHLKFDSDLAGISPYPIVETAVTLGDPAGADMDVTLDRGRVDLTNHKEKGGASVRLHVRKETWTLQLAEPGSSIAIELYGRWPAGVPFTKEPGPKDVPTADMVLLVLNGQVTLKGCGCEHLLTAPPGPATIEWDSVTGQDPTPHRLEKLPAWAKKAGEQTEEARKKKAIQAQMRQRLLETKSIDKVLDELINSDDPMARRLAVVAMGAFDDLKRLGEALSKTTHQDVWDNGVLVLRHWIGRGPGQDQRLYQGLIDRANYSPIQAEAALQLLHSFGEADLARPETYQMLIDYLGHDKLAIRGLANWHLYRLVPAGREIGYSPMASKEERDAAIAKWRKLVPKGTVPSAAKPAEKKK
jgi:hypothetical protein